MPEPDLLVASSPNRLDRTIPDTRPSRGMAARRRGRLLGRLWRTRDGATAVEVAILLPILLIFLFGIEEFGRLLWTQSVLQFAVEVAARCAAVDTTTCPDAASTISFAQNNAVGVSIAAADFTPAPNLTASCGISAGYNIGKQVNVQYAFQTAIDLSGLFSMIPGLGGGANPSALTLTAQSCHP